MYQDFNPWSDHEKKIVADNWLTMSAREIAFLLCRRSRNAVIGVAHRLGLPNKRSPARKIPKDAGAVRAAVKMRYRSPRRLFAAPVTTAGPHQSISLLEAGPDHCRWIMDRTPKDKLPMCCGLPLAGGIYPYCLSHYEIAIDKTVRIKHVKMCIS